MADIERRELSIREQAVIVALTNASDTTETTQLTKAANQLADILTGEPINYTLDHLNILRILVLSGGNLLCMPQDKLPEVEETGSILLGEGATASVRKTLSGKAAVKRVVIEKNNGTVDAFVKEVAALRCCVHPNIIRLQAFGFKEEEAIIVGLVQLPYYNSNLKKDEVSEDALVVIGKKLVDALDYLHHTVGILHNDIKADNILYDSATLHPVLADFGGMCLYDGDHAVLPRAVGAYLYSPTSVLINLIEKEPIVVDENTDRWMLGMTLYAAAYSVLGWFSWEELDKYIDNKSEEYYLGGNADYEEIAAKTEGLWFWEELVRRRNIYLYNAVEEIPNQPLRDLVAELLEIELTEDYNGY